MKCKFSVLFLLILLISCQANLSFSQTWSWTKVDTMFNRTGVYPSWKSAPAFTDFDGDGDYDLAIGCGDGSIQYYENIGDSSQYEWRQNNRIFEGVVLEDSVFVTFANLNGSGVEDLVISCNTYTRPSIKYLINLGSPQNPLWFYDESIFAEIDSLICNPTFADYDQDGDFDMGVLSGFYIFDFHFYENIGSTSQPTWERDTSYFPDMQAPMGEGPYDIYILDMDSDGDCDILATQWVWDNGFAVYGYKNIGSLEDPLWQLIDFYMPLWYYMVSSELAFADLDADGDEDLLMGFLEPNLYLYENIGSAHDMVFDEENPEILGNIWVHRCESVQAFDFDGDGDDDLASTGNVSFWPEFYDYGYFRSWANVGNPYNCALRESSWVRTSFWLTGHWRLTSGDLNGDDRVDLALSWKALASPDTSLLAYLNLYEPGQPRWEQDTTIFSYFGDSQSDSDPELADLDGDGDMDLFVYTEGQFRFYENVGGPSSPEWSERPSWLEGLDDVSHAGRFADLNRDGKFDLTLIASQGLKAYLNTGTLQQPSWTFSPDVFQDLDTLTFSYFDFSDLDGDGDEDLLGGTDGFVFYYENGTVVSLSCEALTPVFCRGKHFYFSLTVNNETGGNVSGQLSFVGYSGYDCDPANILVTIPRNKSYAPGLTVQYYFFKVPNAAGPGQYSASIGGSLGGFNVYCCMNVDIIQCQPWKIGDNTTWELVEVERPEVSLPAITELHQNYPNPFNSSTEIVFSIPEESQVCLTIHNVLGQTVTKPLDEKLPAGEYNLLWNGKDGEGKELPSGLYFYRLSTGEFSDTRKMTILK